MKDIWKDYDIIYFGLFRWDNPYSSVSFSFTKEFIKRNRVFYINPSYTMKDFIKNKNDKYVKMRRGDLLKNKMRYEHIEEQPNIIAVHPPNAFPINWLSSTGVYDTFNKYNNKIVLDTIEKVIKDHNIKKYIFVNCFNPFVAGYLPEPFKPEVNIYQCIDDITQDEWTAKHGKRLEDEAIRKADITVVTSRELHRLKSQINENCYILHNAADLSIFKRTLTEKFSRPEELKGVTGKVIGFTGNLDHLRVDYKLLKNIALAHKDKTLLLVGPINNTEYAEIGLDKLPNVIFTGSKDINILPQYLQHMDCVLIPFLCNTLTKSIYPLKINEYLAAGKSVVASNFSEDIRSFKDVIGIAKSESEFINQIDIAINNNSEQTIKERVAVAESNSWKARVDQFWDIVVKHFQKKGNKKQELV